MAAYYNEIDPFAAQWLRNLIAAGHIAAGDVDERSIADVQPDDLRGYDQCHFFAGIGIWSLALRLAGWPDDRPVWTGSCPCPPFSAAGKRQACPCCASRLLVWCPRRTGYAICSDCGHAWLADARHLWPELWRLIAVCRPPRVFGEQVASSEGLVWLSGVRGSLEICRYAVGASDIPAAGCGAPHIRQRLFWVADADVWMDDASGARHEPARQWKPEQPEGRERLSGMGCEVGRLGDPKILGWIGRPDQQDQGRRECASRHPGPWRSVAILCDDGNLRRVPANPQGEPEPALFPLADAGAVRNRVGLLRGSGNAISPFPAAHWIAAWMETRP